MSDYQEFLATKQFVVRGQGHEIGLEDVNPVLFPFQRMIVKWAVGKGRAAIFAHTGLGKTIMQVEWARLINPQGRTLIIAPLGVTSQTVNEARDLLGLTIHYTRSGSDLIDGINITNYEMVKHFDADQFDAVVLDESSILKGLDSKTRRLLTEMFVDTPYRLCCTATPAPNDYSEIGRHSEFLGYLSDQEMLAAFFVNDMKMKDGTWRLKKNAVKAFYRWLASWSISILKPSDLGFEDAGYDLPPLNIETHFVESTFVPEGQMFFTGLKGITDRSNVRKGTLANRVQKTAEIVNASIEQFIVWHGLNDEGHELLKLIPDAELIEGATPMDKKLAISERFKAGQTRVLISKASIFGFGMNFQFVHNMVFAGMNDSWEQYYQAIRRCWRFKQRHPVNVHVVLADIEDEIWHNIQIKEQQAMTMLNELIQHVRSYEVEELYNMVHKDWQYTENAASGNGWTILLGDSCERLAELPDDSVSLTVSSLPFLSLYTYTPTERDLGNSRNTEEFFKQFQYIIDGLYRITKPGRNVVIHVQQVAATKVNDGYIGIKDFRGDVIRAFTSPHITLDMTPDAIKAEFDKDRFIFHGEVTIDKNPQIQAIRTKTKGLMFVQLHKDSAASRPAFADYLLIFQKPGQNETPIKPDITNEEWIQFAHPVWYDIEETDVLNTKAAKSEEDERHICPLQLGLIERCIRLWSNAGEVVFDPFAGIGSTGYEAVKRQREFWGIELKPEYWRVAQNNLKAAENINTYDLFAWADSHAEVVNE